MNKMTTFAMTLALVSTAQTQTFKGGRQTHETQKRNSERITETREARDQRVKAQTLSRETGIQVEQTNQMVSLLSGISRGQADSTQIKAGMKQEYMVRLLGTSSNSTKIITIKMNDLVEQISKENKRIKDINPNELNGKDFNIHTARESLVEVMAKVVTVASKKYSGSDADLVTSRDAFARFVETATKILEPNSGATARELSEHFRLSKELIAAKESNDRLTDAEVMMIAAEKVQESMAAETVQLTGLKTANESTANKKARVMDYLKGLKECI